MAILLFFMGLFCRELEEHVHESMGLLDVTSTNTLTVKGSQPQEDRSLFFRSNNVIDDRFDGRTLRRMPTWNRSFCSTSSFQHHNYRALVLVGGFPRNIVIVRGCCQHGCIDPVEVAKIRDSEIRFGSGLSVLHSAACRFGSREEWRSIDSGATRVYSLFQREEDIIWFHSGVGFLSYYR